MSAHDKGRLYGIGVGPGDPELLTLKGLRLLRAAAVVAYPAPEHGDSFARAIVAAWLDRGQREIAVRFPMRPGPPPAQIYDVAACAIAAELAAGRDVALLCQGDPLLYGSFIGIWTRLADRFAVEIVPGVSSLTAGAAAVGVPLTARDEVLLVIPATLAEAEIARRLAAADVAAIVKLGRHLPKVKRVLAGLCLLDGACYVERASLPNQRVRPLAGIDEAAYFSMALVRQTNTKR
ncbi:MAG TPA: precorrin-2 C(20)-methyltransferase [Stellaceae bacterium]|nr:precorrin-2 C(20)-methyltransferase [Stellaceae bacterium]